MGNLRYATASADGTWLWDSIEERYFITERRAVENLNEKLEKAAAEVDKMKSLTPKSASAVAARIRALKDRRDVVVIRQTLLRDVSQLKSFEATQLELGYEGVMLRRADQGEYPQKPGKANRSTLNEFYLVRLKRFEYAEANIQDIHILEHNLNEARTAAGRRSTSKAGVVLDAEGLIGSATLRDCTTGKLFDTNVSRDALRRWPGWKNPKLWRGKRIRYKYQVCGTLDKPRINTATFEELLPT